MEIRVYDYFRIKDVRIFNENPYITTDFIVHKEHEIFVDTGAQISILCPSVISKLDLKPVSKIHVVSYGEINIYPVFMMIAGNCYLFETLGLKVSKNHRFILGQNVLSKSTLMCENGSGCIKIGSCFNW